MSQRVVATRNGWIGANWYLMAGGSILQGVRMKPFALAHPSWPSRTNNKSVIYRLQSDSVAPKLRI